MELNKYESRLYDEWKQHGKIIIAVDYDDTISPWKFTSEENKAEYKQMFVLLHEAQKVGAHIIVWSACNPDRYDEIKKYCAENGLAIDGVNETPVENIPYGRHKKIYANIYLDDRAGLNEAYSMLYKVMYIIKGEKESENNLQQIF